MRSLLENGFDESATAVWLIITKSHAFYNGYRFLNEKVKNENCGPTDGIVIHGMNNMSRISYVVQPKDEHTLTLAVCAASSRTSVQISEYRAGFFGCVLSAASLAVSDSRTIRKSG
jgi:hypothetical protein